ncbi:hypothetical protein C6341_g20637 [Phytophthora cactorum]|nr:hypothetical protein C6341_g20637 [Phytophthora cactorum]
MEITNRLVVLSANSVAAEQATLQAGENPNRFLRSIKTADAEERAGGPKRKWLWGPFTSATWEKMLINQVYQRKMFEKWDTYSLETIKERIGQAIIHENNGLAKMMLDYVQIHRVYK